jgi:hypothetical protein
MQTLVDSVKDLRAKMEARSQLSLTERRTAPQDISTVDVVKDLQDLSTWQQQTGDKASLLLDEIMSALGPGQTEVLEGQLTDLRYHLTLMYRDAVEICLHSTELRGWLSAPKVLAALHQPDSIKVKKVKRSAVKPKSDPLDSPAKQARRERASLWREAVRQAAALLNVPPASSCKRGTELHQKASELLQSGQCNVRPISE